MAKVEIKLTRDGPRRIRESAGVAADGAARGARVAAAAGAGMRTITYITGGRGRARTVVVTATGEAMRAEATNRSLTRAIDAGR